MSRPRLLWPLLVLVIMLAANAVVTPGFLGIRMVDGRMYGSLVDILRFGAPLILVATGMTLVIATKGIDLSVGAVLAIAAAVACTSIAAAEDPTSAGAVATGIVLAVLAGLMLGAWNGLLVAGIGIQPIIATLILMTAGRGLAMLVTGGQIVTINSPPYRAIGAGYLWALPMAALIALAVAAVVGLLTRRTALGMLIESVGVNAEASRLAGVDARTITWMVYVLSGACAAVAGIIVSSNTAAADANNAGLWIELDAILAVVIGGTALTGGRFSLAGTLLGALIIQTLTTTVYTMGIAPQVTLLFKAVVVIAVCLVQSSRFRAALWRRRRAPGAVDRDAPVEAGRA